MHPRRLSQPAPMRDPSSPAGARRSMKALLRSDFAVGLREIGQFLEQLLLRSKL